jgi:Lipopolysaccharide kinase (Kdo/WaaP) family
MEFTERYQRHRCPGGVEILVHKRVAHPELLDLLSSPRRIWEQEQVVTLQRGKNRFGYGPLRVGLDRVEMFIKEFYPKSPLDTALSLFRPSRAARSFTAGLEMIRRGLPTPEPLAAITVRRAGWVRGCWLFTEWLPQTVSLRALSDHPERHADVLQIWPWVGILEALGKLLRTMSDAWVCHRDLSLRNVLLDLSESNPAGSPRLWVIDLNRVLTMERDQWSMAIASQNIERLRLVSGDLECVLRAHFPDPREFEAHADLFRRARTRHRLYKRVKKLPRRG